MAMQDGVHGYQSYTGIPEFREALADSYRGAGHTILTSGLIIVLVPTLMFLLISIPMADRHQSRKPGFDAYKAETHALRIL